MDNQIIVLATNFRSQVGGLRNAALEQRKAQYRAAEAEPANAELDRKTEELITGLRNENEKAKLENINKADEKAAAEINAEYGKADELIAQFLGGN